MYPLRSLLGSLCLMLNLIYMLGDSNDEGVQCNLCLDGDGKWSNTATVLIFWQPYSKNCAQHVKALAWMPCCTGSYQMFWYNSDLEYSIWNYLQYACRMRYGLLAESYITI